MNPSNADDLANRVLTAIGGAPLTSGFYALLRVLDALLVEILELDPPPNVRATFLDLQREVQGHLRAASRLGGRPN